MTTSPSKIVAADDSGSASVRRWLARLAPLFAFVVFSIACWMLHKDLKAYSLSEIRTALDATPWWRVVAAGSLVVLNYSILVVYDLLAMKAADCHLPLRRVAFASFLGYTSSFNFGTVLGGTSIRYRLYSGWGLGAADILKIMSMLLLTFWFGILSVAAATFILLSPQSEASSLHGIPLRVVGYILAVVVGGYLLLNAVQRLPIRLGPFRFKLPGFQIAIGQIIIASLDISVAASVLWVLLPGELGVAYPALLAGYVLAIIATVFSQVPGGLGVFELVVLSYAIPNKSPAAIGAVLLYRVIYYLLPLLVAMTMYIGYEWQAQGHRLRGLRSEMGRWVSPVIPYLFALIAFASGVMLLLSNAIPELPRELKALESVLPLSLIETGHLLGSFVGTLLLVLSHGLARRFDSAWVVTTVLVALGAVASLLRGFDWQEAIWLGLVLALLIPARGCFYRHGSLLHMRLSLQWWSAVLIAVTAAFWLGMFAHKHVEYSNDLWWQFALQSDAPRFLRASFVSVVTLLALAVVFLLRGSRKPDALPTEAELDGVAKIVAAQSGTEAHLALMGDKSLLWNDDRTAFVMYSVRGRTWVALGDPVGPQSHRAELAWRFHERVDEFGGSTVFYHIQANSLPIYLQIGLTPVKLGDTARISLAEFSFEGPKYKHLRQASNRFEREGYAFEVISREEVPTIVGRLREVSDQWLAEKNTSEKRFSLGYFDEEYMLRFSQAIVKKDGEILAFANLLETDTKQELSIDLMRHVTEIPNGIMDYLFGQLMLWGSLQEYQFFSLGVAPLSGLYDHPLAPIWNRVGNALFSHGEHFYNFEGLRHYKNKFHPAWEPVYLLYPGGMSLPRILLDLAALNSGSVKSIVGK
ncbi:Phosphatidylglycerol lysyltransferase (Lysylphosphatidylglycerol synthase) (LPG synthase) (Multiple peptide resistance factor) [Durusdinium trenchii]|uniref:Phosphatidylglycerol lysyltransferase (Lysylphosphatidylglycerol synthase) (LPG synthase) (Multiple peptide resistance factor) n=2 Tax=Durusdinium trenchii TaxID=1381693 RepID=A0ABP0N2C7_9DINO